MNYILVQLKPEHDITRVFALLLACLNVPNIEYVAGDDEDIYGAMDYLQESDLAVVRIAVAKEEEE